MNIGGIEIPDNATIEFFGSPFGLDLSRVARLYVRNNGTSKMFHVKEFESSLRNPESGENDLLNGVICRIKFIENMDRNTDEDGAFAEVISGEFKGTILFLKLEKEGSYVF